MHDPCSLLLVAVFSRAHRVRDRKYFQQRYHCMQSLMPLQHPSNAALQPFAPLWFGLLWVFVMAQKRAQKWFHLRSMQIIQVDQLTKSPQRDNFLTLLLSTFHCVTQLQTLSKPFGHNLFICPLNVGFLHPCLLVLIVFGSFILHGNGGWVITVLTSTVCHMAQGGKKREMGNR